MAARTSRIALWISALLLPLHDPIRLAEDMAVLDLISGGRLSIVTGLGYRPVEYDLFGKEWTRRGKLLDEALDVLVQAWTGEPFEYRGQMVQVTPGRRSGPPGDHDRWCRGAGGPAGGPVRLQHVPLDR
jgi:alkanesulfonate monooxygenase SsuD/methylene tetrahydromethanopterin reductase-like flavin-dependent oxidoreductase (luciferase family)